MNSRAVPEVLPVGVARASLSQLLARFRERGIDAEPVLLGSHRRADAVLLPIALFEELEPMIEEILAAREVRRRLAADAGRRVAHEDLLAELGVDPAQLR
jgi:antitoxin StbD